MALQGSGQISLSNIAGEMNQLSQDVSLVAMSTSSTLNAQSPSKPDEAAPHGISEFYSYDHSYSSLKAMSGGPLNSIFSGKWFDFCFDDTKFFYAHSGSGDLPVKNDQVYQNDRGSYYAAGQGYIKVIDPKMGITYVIETNSAGFVVDVQSCEGIEPGGPKEPGFGGEPGFEEPGLGGK